MLKKSKLFWRILFKCYSFGVKIYFSIKYVRMYRAIICLRVLYSRFLLSFVTFCIGMLLPIVSAISPGSVSRCVVFRCSYDISLSFEKKPLNIELNQLCFWEGWFSWCYGLESWFETITGWLLLLISGILVPTIETPLLASYLWFASLVYWLNCDALALSYSCELLAPYGVDKSLFSSEILFRLFCPDIKPLGRRYPRKIVVNLS